MKDARGKITEHDLVYEQFKTRQDLTRALIDVYPRGMTMLNSGSISIV